MQIISLQREITLIINMCGSFWENKFLKNVIYKFKSIKYLLFKIYTYIPTDKK